MGCANCIKSSSQQSCHFIHNEVLTTEMMGAFWGLLVLGNFPSLELVWTLKNCMQGQVLRQTVSETLIREHFAETRFRVL